MSREQVTRNAASDAARECLRDSLVLVMREKMINETDAREFFARQMIETARVRGLRSYSVKKPVSAHARRKSVQRNALQSVIRLLDGNLDVHTSLHHKGEPVYRDNVASWVASLVQATCEDVRNKLLGVPAVGDQLQLKQAVEPVVSNGKTDARISDLIAAAYLEKDWTKVPGLVIQLQQKGI
jgi:hypothetical protein